MTTPLEKSHRDIKKALKTIILLDKRNLVHRDFYNGSHNTEEFEDAIINARTTIKNAEKIIKGER